MTRVLIDTHALLWWLTDDPALSDTARSAIADPSAEPLVSTATVWEIAIKRALGKISVPDELPDQVENEGFAWLTVTADHAWKVRVLPPHHRDPFDRLLVAQGLVEGIPIVTADRRFGAYGIGTLW